MASLVESTLNLFGLTFTGKETKQNLSGALSLGLDDEGASAVINSASLAGSFGTYLDQDGQIKTEGEAIRKYREISLFAEVDVALQEIINEAIPQEQDTKMIKLDLDGLDDVLSDQIKEKIQNEFDEILKLLHYDERAADLFKKWYIDGRMAMQIIVDKDNLTDGIQKLVILDSQNIKKIKEVTTRKTSEGATVIDSTQEYYLYNDGAFSTAKTTAGASIAPTFGLKISDESVIYVTSGIVDNNNGMVLSHLNKAIRPINQLRMLEDATIVYFIARAPERRVFYVDVGNLPKLKAEQYLKDIMNRYRNKMVYDSKTGDVKNDKKYMSMLEDFWMPRRDGSKGTEITQLPGAQNITGYLDSLGWFKEKVYEALSIPIGRLKQETGFSLGQSQTISREEIKFQKFIDRLRNKFGQLMIDALRTQLVLKGIVNREEWEDLKPSIKLDFQKDNYFSELKNQEVLTSRFTMLALVDDYLQKYVPKEWVQKEILKMTDDDIIEMQKQMDKEADDESCWPQWKLQAQQQADAQSEMMKQQAKLMPQPAPGEDGGAPQDGGQGQQQPQKTEQPPEYDSSKFKK